MLAAIIGLFTSSTFGVILGAIGSIINKREDRKSQQIKYEFELRLAELRKSEAEVEMNHELAMADKQVERTEVEGEIAKDIIESNAFMESIKSQSVLSGNVVIDGIRQLMRPLITTYLLIILTILTLKTVQLVGGMGVLSQDTLITILQDIISKILFLTGTAIAWWFGSRNTQPRN